jgi:hypothetical protein
MNFIKKNWFILFLIIGAVVFTVQLKDAKYDDMEASYKQQLAHEVHMKETLKEALEVLTEENMVLEEN